MEFKTLFPDSKFKINRTQLDYLSSLQQKYGNLLGGFSRRGIPVPEPQEKKSILSRILGGLGTWDRLLSSVASRIVERIQGKPLTGKDWLGTLAGAYQIGDLPFLGKYKPFLKQFLPEYEKYENYDWIKFYEDKAGIGKEFGPYKSFHERIRTSVEDMYNKYPWLKSKWTYLLGGPKIADVAENVIYNLTKSPAALAGLGTSIVTDPLTYVSFGVGKGATMPLKLGSKLAKDLAKKVGRETIEELGEVALSPRGLNVLRDVLSQTTNLAKYTQTGKEIMETAGREALKRAVRQISTTKVLKEVAKIGGKKIPKTYWEKFVMAKGGEEALQKAAFNVAQKQIGESLLQPSMYRKLVDIGGIKFFGQTIIPGKIFEKIGFRKLGKLIAESRIGQPIAKGIRNIFTAKGTAPDELYDTFRYHMDFLTVFQKRQLEDQILDFFNKMGLTREQRIDVTRYLAMPARTWSDNAGVILKAEFRDDIIDSIMNNSRKISSIDKGRINNLTIELKKLRAQLDTEVRFYQKDFNISDFNKVNQKTFREWFKQANQEQKELVERIVKMDQIRTIGISKIIDDPIANITNLNSYIDNLVEEVSKKRLFPTGKKVTKVKLRTESQFRELPKETKIRIAKKYGKKDLQLRFDSEIPLTQPFKLSKTAKELQDQMDKVKNELIEIGTVSLDNKTKLVRQTLEIRLEKLNKKYIKELAKGKKTVKKIWKGAKPGTFYEVKPTSIQYQEKLIDKSLDIKSIMNRKKVIESEVQKYLDRLDKITQRPVLSDVQLGVAGKARESFQSLLEKERAYGYAVPSYKNYIPSIREAGIVKKSPFAKPLAVGPEIPSFAKAKKYRTPVEAAEAGIPTELDIATIMYRRGAKSINSVARKRFFQEARQFGKKKILPSEKFTHMKLPIKEIQDLWYPNEWGKFITRAKDFLTDEGTKSFLGFIDTIQGWLRSFLTVIWPGFHMRNFQSNFWQGWLMAGPRYGNPYWHKLATEIIDGADGSVKLGQNIYNYNQLKNMAGELGTLSRGWVGLDDPAMIARELKFGLAPKGYQIARRAQLLTREGLPTQIGQRVGRAIENEARLAGFLINLADTGNPHFAAKMVRKFFFDYGELSATETLFKRGILFYTWIRKNIPLQIEMLLKQPGKFAQIQKVKTYLTHLAEPPEGFEKEKPQFMEELYAMPTPFRDAQGNMLVYNPNFPWQDLGRVNLNDLYAALTPLIRVPFELVSNKEIYFGRNIAEYSGQTKPAPGYLGPLKYLPETMLNILGLKVGYDINTNEEILLMPAKAEYITRQLPFLTSLARSIPQVSESEKGAFSTLSTLGGIKFIPYDEKKASYYWTKEQMEELEGLIKELKKVHEWPELMDKKTFKGFRVLK